ncbi:helix-turn-helix transcriptional regulator [Cohnella silvisoli]|uniref:AraC family transcriptional regulator n=1 Tax=Cohnella silvisoli TaxID=2873699 RepID=A0ABV1KLS0_9BACL|nr:AraC family transcriptional regulator [Cohnella silvisoli]MCD9020629.1 AraC family transcriptional regulator [Cohnella silvisoli]
MTMHRWLNFSSRSFPSFISAGKRIFQPGERHDERIFPAFVAMFVIKGIVHLMEDGVPYEIKDGEWFIQTPGLRHFGYKESDQETVYYWIHFLPGDWEISASDLSAPGRIVKIDMGDGLRVPDTRYSLNMNYGPFPCEEWDGPLESIVEAVLVGNWTLQQSRFMQLLERMMEFDPDRHLIPSNTVALQVYRFLLENFRKPIRLKQLAQNLHYSVDYLSRCFRLHYQTTPSAFLHRLRMEEAKLLLATSGYSVRRIAVEVGYEELSVFSRAFKNDQNVSPVQYRERIYAGGMLARDDS